MAIEVDQGCEALVQDEKDQDHPVKKADTKRTNLLKYGLIFINVVTILIGLVLLIVGSVYYSSHEFISDAFQVGSNFCSVSVYCIVLGAIIIAVSIVGLYGAIRSDYCCLMSFSILMGLAACLEAILAVTFFSVITSENPIVARFMKSTMKNYDESHRDHGLTKAWNLLQTELKCCGVDDANDWHEDPRSDSQFPSPNHLPESCCEGFEFGVNATRGECLLDSAERFRAGCLPKLRDGIRQNGGAIGGVIIAFVICQVGLVVASVHLRRRVSSKPASCPPFY